MNLGNERFDIRRSELGVPELHKLVNRTILLLRIEAYSIQIVW